MKGTNPAAVTSGPGACPCVVPPAGFRDPSEDRAMAKDNAGVLVVARRTQLYPGRPLLLGKRGGHLGHPHTWADWGGGMRHGEAPAEAAAREFREESGFAGPLTLVPGSEW